MAGLSIPSLGLKVNLLSEHKNRLRNKFLPSDKLYTQAANEIQCTTINKSIYPLQSYFTDNILDSRPTLRDLMKP